MRSGFVNKVVVVTGGGSGIGEACAKAYAREGASVSVIDVDGDRAEMVAERIREKGGSGIALQCDVSRVPAVDAVFQEVVSRYGRVDITVNSAGVASPNLFIADTQEGDYDRVLSVNLKGVWACMRAALQHMTEKGAGTIVNIASTMSLRVQPGNGLYVASKFGVAGLTRTAAVEYAKTGIRINAICPGSVLTGMFSGAVTDEKEFAVLKSLHPMDRLGTPEEIANAVLWISSDDASFVTGSILPVDGGWTAQ